MKKFRLTALVLSLILVLMLGLSSCKKKDEEKAAKEEAEEETSTANDGTRWFCPNCGNELEVY